MDDRLTDERVREVRSGTRGEFARARLWLAILLSLYAAVTSYAVASMFVGIPGIVNEFVQGYGDYAEFTIIVFELVNTVLIPGVVGLVIGMHAVRGILVPGEFSHPELSYELPSLWRSALLALGLAILNLLLFLLVGLATQNEIVLLIFLAAKALTALAFAATAIGQVLLSLRDKWITVSAVTAVAVAFCGAAPIAVLSFPHPEDLPPPLVAVIVPPLPTILILLPLLLGASRAYARRRRAGSATTEG